MSKLDKDTMTCNMLWAIADKGLKNNDLSEFGECLNIVNKDVLKLFIKACLTAIKEKNKLIELSKKMVEKLSEIK